jgi:hypothetical protein
MSTSIHGSAAFLLGVFASSAMYFLTATAQEPNGSEQKRDDNPASIIGAWTAEDTHLSLGALYQPAHPTRQRRSRVYFELKDGKLTGHSFTPYFKEIVFQKGWDGHNAFTSIKFADGKLVFEIDSKEVSFGWEGAQKEPAIIRVEAQIKDDRLVGKWGVFLRDGSEPFRGGWEAVRAKEPESR